MLFSFQRPERLSSAASEAGSGAKKASPTERPQDGPRSAVVRPIRLSVVSSSIAPQPPFQRQRVSVATYLGLGQGCRKISGRPAEARRRQYRRDSDGLGAEPLAPAVRPSGAPAGTCAGPPAGPRRRAGRPRRRARRGPAAPRRGGPRPGPAAAGPRCARRPKWSASSAGRCTTPSGRPPRETSTSSTSSGGRWSLCTRSKCCSAASAAPRPVEALHEQPREGALLLHRRQARIGLRARQQLVVGRPSRRPGPASSCRTSPPAARSPRCSSRSDLLIRRSPSSPGRIGIVRIACGSWP